MSLMFPTIFEITVSGLDTQVKKTPAIRSESSISPRLTGHMHKRHWEAPARASLSLCSPSSLPSSPVQDAVRRQRQAESRNSVHSPRDDSSVTANGLGAQATQLGSSLLVMAIIGGAVCAAVLR